jgi:hypothetical protein
MGALHTGTLAAGRTVSTVVVGPPLALQGTDPSFAATSVRSAAAV